MKHSIKAVASTLIIVLGMCATTARAQDSITDPDLIRQAQDLLYNLNYKVGERDGRMNNDTRQALRDFQSDNGLSDNGILSIDLLLRIRDKRAPSTWGAISAAVDGGWGSAWNYGNRAEAEERAINGCKNNSKLACEALAVHSSKCLAAYHWQTSERWGWRMRSGDSVDKAKLNALSDCKEHRSGNAPCTLLTAICADGRHKNN